MMAWTAQPWPLHDGSWQILQHDKIGCNPISNVVEKL
jgi:hypothetical protein